MCMRLSKDSMRSVVSWSCGCGFVVSTVVAKCALPPEQARDVFRDLDAGSLLSVVVRQFVTDMRRAGAHGKESGHTFSCG
jgi:hypothetical protein